MRVTRAQYARHRKVSAQYVSRLVSTGRIVLGRDGKIDREKADAALGRKERKRPQVVPAKPSRGSGVTLTEARTRKEMANAQLAELELKTKSGNLLQRERVLEEQTRIFANIRTRFRRLPRSVAAIVAHMTSPAEIEAKILDAVDQILSDLAADPLAPLPALEPMDQPAGAA